MRSLFKRWLADVPALWGAILVVPGIQASPSIPGVCSVLLLFGLVSSLLRPAFLLLSFPIILVTTVPLKVILNAAALVIYAEVARFIGLDLRVDGFMSALLGALVMGIIRTGCAMLPGVFKKVSRGRMEQRLLQELERKKIRLQKHVGVCAVPGGTGAGRP